MSYPRGTAAAAHLAACHVCHTLTAAAQHSHCTVCGARLHLRKPNSIQRCLAFLLTACVFYIPANLLPIMDTVWLGTSQPNTIAGGVVTLLHHGAYFVAGVIFIASVMVPVAKIAAISWLCYSVSRKGPRNRQQLDRLYTITELIGKWSMVDVFVVALLVALVKIEGVIVILPGTAALAFAAVVILTMFSARSFDRRLIWDR